ncbi:TBC1 domain protein [Apiospora phragmitis]|uniref:TBC1 domain protein n=1 Tax=Apiospora phragmitis TaxID=2905665 RepID=A0ABR1W1C6_9PEZI
MAPADLPALNVGFEFECWIATIYIDVERGDYPYKGERVFVLTGTNSTGSEVSVETRTSDGEILTDGYNKWNPAPDDWNPNEDRMPTEAVVQGMQNSFLTTVANVVGSEKVSNLNTEHPNVGDLVDGVSRAFRQHTAHRDDGRERNLSSKTWRKDTHVYEGKLYFVAFEWRTRVYVRANKEGGKVMREELRVILKRIPEEHNVSINAGNDCFYELPPSIKTKHSVQPGEARAGIHIHVSAEGVFDTPTQGLTVEEHREQREEIMKKRILASKKLITLYWLVEPNICKLHASWRSKDPRYAGLLRHHSNLAFYLLDQEQKDNSPYKHWEHDKEENQNKAKGHYNKGNFDTHGKIAEEDLDSEAKTMYDAVIAKLPGESEDRKLERKTIKTIWSCTNMDQLVWLCASYFGNRRAALSLNQLLPAYGSIYNGGGLREPAQRLGTVEFRAMQGSFDPEAVIAWSDVVMRLTEPCVTEGTDAFVNFVNRVMEAPEPGDTVKAFIKRLGFDEESRPYKFYSDGLQARLDIEAMPRIGGDSTPNVLVPRK